jgi:hypothetical protein
LVVDRVCATAAVVENARAVMKAAILISCLIVSPDFLHREDANGLWSLRPLFRDGTMKRGRFAQGANKKDYLSKCNFSPRTLELTKASFPKGCGQHELRMASRSVRPTSHSCCTQERRFSTRRRDFVDCPVRAVTKAPWMPN